MRSAVFGRRRRRVTPLPFREGAGEGAGWPTKPRTMHRDGQAGTIGPLVRAGTSMPKRHRLAPKLKSRASALRRDSTLPERLLWSRLRADRLPGFKFRRQAVIDRFVVDFYCPAAKLIIEIDGVSHDGRRLADASRTDRLAALGYRVIRYNDQVLEDADAVTEDIANRARLVLHG